MAKLTTVSEDYFIKNEVKAENETFGTKELNQLSNPDHTPKNTLSFLEPVEDPEFGFYEMASMALKKSSTSPVN
ncbi:hypothetical protein QYM36_007664 [Artemia franciscana]|uniref:Uncharacterized protein n=1 Tax=Artemia franciscana TaxID=6661 RepID=A0AA88IDZ5_ARTSF|nr:hypothetical protein QYM36_007664 [Artemia franciscana]KAK2726890.1 hypothetical protein QYM36_007664 [Artemia franciscana]KAK2726891.1 hypothetical protein QYM36_007664 [Artemia franciscana]